MVACKTGHVATVPIEHRRTVNPEWYTAIYLLKVFAEIRKTIKRRRIIVHHGNARFHTSALTNPFLTGQNVEFMCHPPYSPMRSFYTSISRKKAWAMIFVARRCCWSVQKPCFGGVSIEVEKVLRQVWKSDKSCWRMLWKTIKTIFIIMPEIYRETIRRKTPAFGSAIWIFLWLFCWHWNYRKKHWAEQNCWYQKFSNLFYLIVSKSLIKNV